MTEDRPIPMVDLKAQYRRLKSSIDEEIQKVLDSAYFIKGPIVGEFECSLAAAIKAPYVLGVANGTDALQVAMMALDIGPGDEVITPSFTFVATAEAARLLGATPVFIDVESDTFNIDPSKLEALITPRTKAIIPVHLFGQPADMDPIMEIANRHGVHVIEDAAQAIGTTYKNSFTCTMGTVGTISFFPSKNLGAYGDAGAVVTSDEALYHRMKMIASHGSKKKYFNEIIGINSRLDSLQAAVLKAKLPFLQQFNSERAAAADRYDDLLSGVDEITVPVRRPDRTHAFHQYTIKIDGGATIRDAVSAYLKDRKIGNAVYYPKGLHQLPVNADVPVADGSLNVTEDLSDQVLSLPIYPEISREDQARISSTLIDAVRASKSIQQPA